ncbi:hypothetical protein JTB14_036618 [Gonioctena quinquepunctata]|nr:hypothetical protein JTB14_036618 [Gonioctena quinquepunctata]
MKQCGFCNETAIRHFSTGITKEVPMINTKYSIKVLKAHIDEMLEIQFHQPNQAKLRSLKKGFNSTTQSG